MSNSITYVQSVVAMSAAEGASNKMASGAEGVDRGENRRKELQKKIEDKEKEIQELMAKIEEQANAGSGTHFLNWLGGSDGGMSDMQKQQQLATAEMKRAQQEMVVAQTQIEMMLQELQGAQSELGQRSSEREKAYDEHEQAATTAQS